MAGWREHWKPSVQPRGAADHTQPTLLPFHKQAQEQWWNTAVPDSLCYFLERKNVAGSKTAFQEQQQRKNTQPTLGQLGRAVKGIHTSQDATEPKRNTHCYQQPRIQGKHKIQFCSRLAKKCIKKRIVHVTEGTQPLQK